MPEAVAFGKRIRELRRKPGLTQARLAGKADLHVIHLSTIERGANEPKLTTILRLARALGIPVGELLRPFR